MNYFDIALLIPLAWGAFKGFKKGFIIEIASFIALGLGIRGGMKFSSISAKYLSNAFDISEKVMPLISFAVTFIGIVIIVFTLAKLLQKVITMVALGFINRAAGAIFGMLKFGLIMSIIVNFSEMINNQIPFIEPSMKKASLLYHPIGEISKLIIPNIKEIDTNKLLNNKLLDTASSKIEEATENLK